MLRDRVIFHLKELRRIERERELDVEKERLFI